MLFNSLEFIFIFLPVSFFIYFYLNKIKLTTASKIWLVSASLFFYGYWNTSYLPLILISVLFNFFVARAMEGNIWQEHASKKSLLIIGLIFNIGLLGYFKYVDFFISNTNSLLGTELDLLYIALPLAISFFTLQQIAFLIDTYEGLAKEKKFLDYAVFVTFFPQLIAGPIVHHKEMMPQFVNVRNKVINFKNIVLGIFIFSLGLFKKVVIADTFSIWATRGFDISNALTFLEAWATSISYTFQLYFDFSGYTDMAIGAALLFNIRLPINFDSPLKATSIINFWQRWHITLTNFITSYIYTPLVRSFTRLSFNKAMLATFITFLIAGLWHGASWMFVVFGGLHGMALVVNNYWNKFKFKLNDVFAWFITFNFVNIAFIFFRAKEWDDAIKVLGGMFSLKDIVLPDKLSSNLSFLTDYGVQFGSWAPEIIGDTFTILWIILGFSLVLIFKNSVEYTKSLNIRYLYIFSIVSISFSMYYIMTGAYSEFIYFAF